MSNFDIEKYIDEVVARVDDANPADCYLRNAKDLYEKYKIFPWHIRLANELGRMYHLYSANLKYAHIEDYVQRSAARMEGFWAEYRALLLPFTVNDLANRLHWLHSHAVAAANLSTYSDNVDILQKSYSALLLAHRQKQKEPNADQLRCQNCVPNALAVLCYWLSKAYLKAGDPINAYRYAVEGAGLFTGASIKVSQVNPNLPNDDSVHIARSSFDKQRDDCVAAMSLKGKVAVPDIKNRWGTFKIDNYINEVVRLGNSKKTDDFNIDLECICKLEKAKEQFPNHKMLIRNLGIYYNNYGVSINNTIQNKVPKERAAAEYDRLSDAARALVVSLHVDPEVTKEKLDARRMNLCIVAVKMASAAAAMSDYSKWQRAVSLLKISEHNYLPGQTGDNYRFMDISVPSYITLLSHNMAGMDLKIGGKEIEAAANALAAMVDLDSDALTEGDLTPGAGNAVALKKSDVWARFDRAIGRLKGQKPAEGQSGTSGQNTGAQNAQSAQPAQNAQPVQSQSAGAKQENKTAMQRLDGMIGLEGVKREVHALVNQMRLRKMRMDQGLPVPPISLHMVFSGNPGTGKTTVARIIGEIYKDIGLLEKGHVVEVDRGDLVGGFIGQTAIKTKEKVDAALGGVLFIDEAYTLANASEKDYGQEAIDTILKAMEDNRDNLVVIAAGYTEEMMEFIKSNPGLESRFSKQIFFADYTAKEMEQIFYHNANEYQYIVDDAAREDITRAMETLKRRRGTNFANGRTVRNLFEKVLAAQSDRLQYDNDVTLDEMQRITKADVIAVAGQEEPDEDNIKKAMAQLDGLVGLEEVKQEVNRLVSLAAVQSWRRKQNLEAAPVGMHMVFSGNPGTGKTTVARIVAQVYKELGLLSRGHLVEVDRSDLVAPYVGQTAGKTQSKIDSAMGGVLFIDEAYTLSRDNGKGFGQESIDTLLKAMEDNRDDLVVIVAGYKNEMKQFIASNPGLQSRFNNYIDFADYDAAQLQQIFVGFVKSRGYVLTDGAKAAAFEALEAMYQNRGEHFGNARSVRNFFEAVISAQASRLFAGGSPDATALITITEDDVNTAANQ